MSLGGNWNRYIDTEIYYCDRPQTMQHSLGMMSHSSSLPCSWCDVSKDNLTLFAMGYFKLKSQGGGGGGGDSPPPPTPHPHRFLFCCNGGIPPPLPMADRVN